ncbi:MAG: hypothetical protein WBB39_00590 [Candidatus Saccharimonadales bacterium]
MKITCLHEFSFERSDRADLATIFATWLQKFGKIKADCDEGD